MMQFKVRKCPDCGGKGSFDDAFRNRSGVFCDTCMGDGTVAVMPYRKETSESVTITADYIRERRSDCGTPDTD